MIELKGGEDMSYSIYSTCGACGKAKGCTDKRLLESALSGIHSMGQSSDGAFGHLGYGTIALQCGALEPIKPAAAPSAEDTART
ncbi:MAG: hypothetical protein M0Z52_07480 [Actinomycetota bacterium]|nr:hypothetical protein [Actinomycetota bacterium]